MDGIQRRLTRRHFLAISGGVIGTAILAACGATASPTAAPAAKATEAPQATTAAATATTAPAAAATAAKVSLDFWNPAGDKLGKQIIDSLVASYNEKSTVATVKNTVVPDENNYAKYTTAISAGTPPDAIMTYWYGPIVSWAAEGFILPIDDYQEKMGIKKEDYFPVVWQMINFHGHLWGFLQEFDFDIIGYNKNLFKAAGLDPEAPPKTIIDLDAMNEKLTVKDSSGGLKQVGFCQWIGRDFAYTLWWRMFGGGFYDNVNDKFTIVTDPNIKCLDWYNSTGKLLGGPDKVTSFTNLFTGGADPFYQEQVAIAMQGEYNPIAWPDSAPKAMDHLGLAWPPTAEGVPYGTGQTDGGNVFLLPKGVKNPSASMDFMTFMGGPEAVLKWNVEENNIPPVKAVALSDDFAKATPLMKPWIELLKQDKMGPAITSPLAPFFFDHLSTAVQEVLYGKKDSKQSLTDLTQVMDEEAAKFKSSHPNW